MKRQLHETLAKLETAIKQVRIIPAGSNDPLPPVPDVVEVDESDFDDISAVWDETMPELAGMLDAEVVNRERTE